MNQVLTLNSSLVRPFTIGWKINLKTFWIFSSVLVVFLLAFYIFQVAEVTKTSYLIANYETELVELSQGNERIESIFSQVNSLANLENLLMSLDYEKVGKIHYLRVLEGTAMAK